MQKFRKTKIVASILTIATLLITTISPIASAASSFNTEGQVKNALYAAAAYECINSTILQNTAIGNKRDSIIPSADTQKVFIGQWLGDANGQITCKDALTKTLGGGNITTNMLNSGQVLNGVYTQSASGEQQIRCNYGIVNSSGNATMDGTYSWPQGYIYDINGNLVDKRSHGVIEVVFNESGPIRLVGATSDIDTTHTLESMRSWLIDWSQPSKICSNLVHYTEVYPIGQVENPMGETISAYAEVLATTDRTPFNEWGPHVDDRYHAWLYYSDKNDQTRKFTHTLSTPTSSSTQLELTSDAKKKLLSNISTLHLNGATDVASFLNSSADAKYILYGRYLFNGDGNGSFACGGISVATDDPDFSELSATDYWDTSQPYVATVNAYKESTATSKTAFRTKFGGDGLLSPGSAKNIWFPGVAGDCKALAGEFNNTTPTSSSAKTAVKNFMKVGSVEELPDTNTPGSTDPGDDANGGTVGALDGCFSNAGVLGWILCPVLKLAGAATDGIYDMIVENYLSVKSETMTSTALRDAWGTFQGYANVLFAILLIIVILSQVTGIGLSNYGIKKVLPKLIITIILVNLSYIMCAVMVDLSNIVGVSLNDLLSGMDAGGLVASEINIGTMVLNSVEGIGLTALAIGAGGTVITIAAEAWPNLILVLFLAVISILISILFFFILLVVRQAAIIILVVIAPLAVVCYALPNTQKLFDRWLKAFSSLLLVFPICGAVMGGCNYASRLLLSAGGNNGLLYYIIVMVLGVVPLFFIPSILKSSMTALGNAGRMLATAGDRFSRWANRSIVGSQAFQDRKQEAQRNVNMTRNGRIMRETKLDTADQRELKRLRDKRASGGTLTAAERRDYRRLSSREFRYARAASAREKALRDEQQSGIIANREAYDYGTNRYKAAQEGYETSQRLSDIKDQKALYEAGQVAGVDADSIDSLQAEHKQLLARVSQDVNGTDRASRAKLEAVQELLGDKQDKGLEAMYENYLKMSGDSGVRQEHLEGMGIKNAVRHLRSQYGANIKKGNRGFDNLITQLQNNGMNSLRSSVQTAGTARGDTRDLSELLADDFAARTLKGYNAGSLNDMHDATLQRYIDMAQNGRLGNSDLSDFAKIINEAFASGSINLKGEVGQKAQQFLESAYGAGAVARTSANASSVVTAGSDAFKHASIQSLQQLSSGLANGSISGAAAQRIAENARRYMESGALIEPERAQELRQILTTAQSKGITGLAGATDRFNYDEASFKVRGAKQKVAMPTGWTRRSNGKWYDASGNPLSGADAVRAQQILEHNNQIDIENGRP